MSQERKSQTNLFGFPLLDTRAETETLTHRSNGGDHVDELVASQTKPSSLRRLGLDFLEVIGPRDGFSFRHV